MAVTTGDVGVATPDELLTGRLDTIGLLLPTATFTIAAVVRATGAPCGVAMLDWIDFSVTGFVDGLAVFINGRAVFIDGCATGVRAGDAFVDKTLLAATCGGVGVDVAMRDPLPTGRLGAIGPLLSTGALRMSGVAVATVTSAPLALGAVAGTDTGIETLTT